MRKNFLYFLLTSNILIILLGTTCIHLYFNSDVDKLRKHYPIYDESNGKYLLQVKRPSYWVTHDEISNYAKWAIIVSEDWAFFEHNGIDVRQFFLVVKQSLIERRLVRGASTISMQVIKNTLLTSEKSLWRKFRELILTVKLENFYSKEQILEIYLNLIELGDGIYGIKNASEFYFNKQPNMLTAREGAFLAMLLPNPKKYSISFKDKKLTDFAKEQIDKIMIKLRQAKIYKEEDRIIEADKKFHWEKNSSVVPVIFNAEDELFDFEL